MLRWDNNGPLDFTLIGDYTRDDHQRSRVLTVSNYPYLTGGSGQQHESGNQYAVWADRRLCLDDFPGHSNSRGAGSSAENIVTTRPTTIRRSQLSASLPAEDYSSQRPGKTSMAACVSGWGISGHLTGRRRSPASVDHSLSASMAERFTNDDDGSPLTGSLGQITLTFWSFSQELRLNGQFAENMIEYTFGGYLHEAEIGLCDVPGPALSPVWRRSRATILSGPTARPASYT